MSTMEEEKAAAGSKVDAGVVAEPFRQEVRAGLSQALQQACVRLYSVLSSLSRPQ